MPSNQNKPNNKIVTSTDPTEVKQNICGIVMPIAAMGDYSEAHWLDVQNIIKEAVSSAGYTARLVSESVEATVIIRSIVQNVYSDEIVVCDVSGMNPNVMFELGMRLAFDKPVVIIKDTDTRFSFDINTIEHLEYPKSLRYQTIQEFKIKLSEKIKGTLNASKDEENYRSFLSNFGSFTVANLKDTTLNESEALERILNKLDRFDYRLNNLEHNKDTDNAILNHLNRGASKPYRILFRIDVDSNINNEKFSMICNELDKLYSDSIRVTLGHDGKTQTIKILTNISGSKEVKVLNDSISVLKRALDKPEE